MSLQFPSAAGLCTGTISAFSDWYLPAICEMGYGANSAGINCGLQLTPAEQNIQSNLIDINNTDIAGLTAGSTSGLYWSSTEYSPDPTAVAWFQVFVLNGGASFQGNDHKGNHTLGVRCSRALTL